MSSRKKSEHQQRVENFMRRAKQLVPDFPAEPTVEDCIRVVRVAAEEFFEMTKGFGVGIYMKPPTVPPPKQPMLLQMKELVFKPTGKGFDFVQAVDGALDLIVTTTCALSACGIADEEPQRIVDEANLRKFGPGHSFRDDGKLIKPPDFVKPDIAAAIQRQVAESHRPMPVAEDQNSVKSGDKLGKIRAKYRRNSSTARK